MQLNETTRGHDRITGRRQCKKSVPAAVRAGIKGARGDLATGAGIRDPILDG